MNNQNQAAQAATHGASIEAERPAFEAWAKNEYENLGGEFAGPGETGWYYWDDETAAAFEGWLACAARRTPAAAAGAGDLTASGLTQDEMTRLRRMMRALNIDEKRWDDEQARDAMCTVFGMAAGQLEGIAADRAQRLASVVREVPDDGEPIYGQREEEAGRKIKAAGLMDEASILCEAARRSQARLDYRFAAYPATVTAADAISSQIALEQDRTAPATAGMVEDAKDATPIISSYDIAKVKSLKSQFVESLIHNGIQYGTCGAISATLNRIIDASEVAAMAAQQAKASAKDKSLDPNQVQTVSDRIRNTRGLPVAKECERNHAENGFPCFCAKESGAMGDDLKGAEHG